jgi:hypothetical protein
LALLTALLWMLCEFAGLSHASELLYSVQLGSFVNPELAQKQFDRVRAKLPEDDLDSLRIEQYQTYRSVRLGRFPKRADAEALLAKVRPLVPDAYIVRVQIDEKLFVRTYEKRPADKADRPARAEGTEQRKPSPPRQEPRVAVPPPPDKVERKPLPEPREVSLLKGTVVSAAAVSPHIIGLSGDSKVYRVVVSVAETKEVTGMAHLLRGREGETLTFFSEEPGAADLRGRKIEAKAVYLGENRGKLFWLKDIKVIE